MNKVLLTKEGLMALKKELDERTGKKRDIINANVNLARQEGDLSENEAYSAAILERDLNEARIKEIEEIIDNYDLVEQTDNEGIVHIGSVVEVKSDKGTKIFTIVGASESNPLENKISIDSPIGELLLGKKVGDSIVVNTETSSVAYDIVNIRS